MPIGDLSAEDYLEHARADIVNADRRGIINALGNAKRSIHYQVDRLLYRYCLYSWAQENRIPFPQRLETLADLRLLSVGKVLGFYNGLRNAVEHEYVLPSKGTIFDSIRRVEEALELSELLLLATERPLYHTPRSMVIVANTTPNEFEAVLEPGSPHLRVGAEFIPLSRKNSEIWLEIVRAFSLASRTRHPLSVSDSVMYI